MKITRNGTAYTPKRITRQGNTVLVDVGCETVAIDMEALRALTEAKEPGFVFWWVLRDRQTGVLISAHRGTHDWRTCPKGVCMVNEDGTDGGELGTLGSRIVRTRSRGRLSSAEEVWCIEYHKTKPTS